MKKSIILLGLCILSILACKKDPVTPTVNFETITRADIVADLDKINQSEVTYDAQAGTNFKAGSIIFFKTKAGNYGKIKVVNVTGDEDLVIDVVTFNTDSSKLVDKTNFTPVYIKAYDLDMAELPESVGDTADFTWISADGTYKIVFTNEAFCYLHSI